MYVIYMYMYMSYMLAYISTTLKSQYCSLYPAACGGCARAYIYQTPVTVHFEADFMSDVAVSQSESRAETF